MRAYIFVLLSGDLRSLGGRSMDKSPRMFYFPFFCACVPACIASCSLFVSFLVRFCCVDHVEGSKYEGTFGVAVIMAI